MSDSITSTFGTSLTPINTTTGLFKVNTSYEATMDTPIALKMGTKKIFNDGSIVEGTLWEEYCPKKNRTRKIVMVQDGDDGRYFIPKSKLTPTTKLEIEAENSKSELNELSSKVDNLLQGAEKEADELLSEPKPSFLDKEYLGFSGKQILVASLGAIILIKIFK
jgi:hypothetical protein